MTTAERAAALVDQVLAEFGQPLLEFNEALSADSLLDWIPLRMEVVGADLAPLTFLFADNLEIWVGSGSEAFVLVDPSDDQILDALRRALTSSARIVMSKSRRRFTVELRDREGVVWAQNSYRMLFGRYDEPNELDQRYDPVIPPQW